MEGGANLYRYVRNPSTWCDPFGLNETGPFDFEEGQVMTYREYQNRRARNRRREKITDDFEGHHIPSTKKLKEAKIDKKNGTVVVMKHKRHVKTSTYGNSNQGDLCLKGSQEADLNDEAMTDLGGPQGETANNVREMNKANHPKHFL